MTKDKNEYLPMSTLTLWAMVAFCCKDDPLVPIVKWSQEL